MKTEITTAADHRGNMTVLHIPFLLMVKLAFSNRIP